MGRSFVHGLHCRVDRLQTLGELLDGVAVPADVVNSVEKRVRAQSVSLLQEDVHLLGLFISF